MWEKYKETHIDIMHMAYAKNYHGHVFPGCFQGVSWGVSEIFLGVPGVS